MADDSRSAQDRKDDTLMTAWINQQSPATLDFLNNTANGYLAKNASGNWVNPRANEDSSWDKFMSTAIPLLTAGGLGAMAAPALIGALGSVGGAAASGAVSGAAGAGLTGQPIGKGALTGAVGGGLGAGIAATGAGSGISSALGGGAFGNAASGALTGAAGGAAGSALLGGNVGRGALTGALGGAGRSLGNTLFGGLGGMVGAGVGSYLGNGLSGGPASSGVGGSSPPSYAGAGSSYGNNMANSSTGTARVGIDDPNSALSGFSGLLGNLGGLYGSVTGAQSQQNNSANYANAMTTAQRAGNLNPFNFKGIGGASAYGGPNGVGTQLSPGFNSAFTGMGNLANRAVGNANNTMGGGLPPALQAAMARYGQQVGMTPQGTQGQLGQLFGNNNLAAGTAAGLMGQGFNQLNNPLIGQANNAAGQMIGNANQSYGTAYNTALQNIQAAMQRPEQQQMAALQNQEFERGQLGTSGGALQTEAMAQGFGNANLNAQIQANTQGLQAQQQAMQGAGLFSGIGAQQMGLGNSLLANALGQFNNTSGIGSNIANSIFGQNQAIQQTGYNQAMQNVGMQQGGAMFPTQLAGAQLGLATQAGTGANTLNQMGLNNFGAGLNFTNAQNTAMQGSARNQILGSINPQLTGNAGYGNLFSQLLGNNGQGITGAGGALNSQTGIMSNLAKLFGGGGSGGGAPTGGYDNYGGDIYSGAPMGGYDPSIGAGADLQTMMPDLNYGGYDPNMFASYGGGV